MLHLGVGVRACACWYYELLYRDLPCNRWIFESDLTDFGRFRFPKFPVLILHRLLDVTSITDIARC